ncbi:hypothetical protein QBC46DRAFT_140077 [Diplogelasinospora grovesii]|uniref:Secreted protein n=1 Tax=Diplogelasinospora grovesii TaxID=303347 RepID=A0AAN6S4Q7_9PEZI|nr:hypothetical protein QBC46DRAFT_140077 [Diplogelasinospora grovesii]
MNGSKWVYLSITIITVLACLLARTAANCRGSAFADPVLRIEPQTNVRLPHSRIVSLREYTSEGMSMQHDAFSKDHVLCEMR